MAKRTAPDEKPYRPLLDADLVSTALSQVGPAAAPIPPPIVSAPSPKVLELPKAEPPRRQEPPVAVESFLRDDAIARFRDLPAENVYPLVEKIDQEKRILFTRLETQAIDRLVVSLAGRLNTTVKVSHVVRALMALLLNAESEIDRRAGQSGPMTRPPNGDAQGVQRFERNMRRIIACALRDAPTLK